MTAIPQDKDAYFAGGIYGEYINVDYAEDAVQLFAVVGCPVRFASWRRSGIGRLERHIQRGLIRQHIATGATVDDRRLIPVAAADERSTGPSGAGLHIVSVPVLVPVAMWGAFGVWRAHCKQLLWSTNCCKGDGKTIACEQLDGICFWCFRPDYILTATTTL